MNNPQIEKTLQRLISWGTLVTILAVTTFISIEPVNIPKMLILTIIGFAGLSALLTCNYKVVIQDSKALVFVLSSFIISGIISLITSSAPVVQTFYGVFGRNTGLLTYISLALVLMISASLRSSDSHKKIINFIMLAGLINIIYCAIALAGRDLLSWNNTYGKILGTLGNPDFVAAFLGIGICLFLPFLFANQTNLVIKITGLISSLLALYEIKRSGAQQGFFVFALGIFVLIFFLLKSKFQSRIPIITFGLLSVLVGISALLGMLQIGPLTQFVYKTSISLRGVYWDAGIKMGLDNPAFGIGLDGYGDNYRLVRSAQAMITPGPNTVTNAAHNVLLDIFAGGGFVFLLLYLAILIITIKAILILTKRSKSFDPILVALISGWTGYQIQSIISINQIGLAICGWVLSGLLISYEVITRPTSTSNDQKKSIVSGGKGVRSLIPAVLGGMVGLIIALPPMVVDISWRSALNQGDGARVIQISTTWPQDIYRMNQITSALEQNGLLDQAAVNARKAVEFNPSSFDAWQILFRIQKSTPEEKEKALKQLRLLDPRNPNPA